MQFQIWDMKIYNKSVIEAVCFESDISLILERTYISEKCRHKKNVTQCIYLKIKIKSCSQEIKNVYVYFI